MSEVVVIGAGVGGLAVAARLAALGHRVTLVERAAEVGGKLGRFERQTPAGPVPVDTRPGRLTQPHVLAALFAATGSTVERELDLVPLDPIVRHRFADGTALDSCADPAEFAHRIAFALGPHAAAQWQRLWPHAQRSWDVSWRHVLRTPV
ncbi:MAG: FAD-dependent oxidoreductase, partial [Micromonosporaceae bacterium]